MRPGFPRSRLGVFRATVVVAEITLAVLLVGSTGALGPLGDGALALRDRWGSPALTPESRGAQAYQANCAGCHGGAAGGGATDVPPKHNANGHTWQHADCELLATVRTGATTPLHGRATAFAPASPMPAWQGRLTDDDIRDVIAYMRTLWTDGQRASQARLTAERCGAR